MTNGDGGPQAALVSVVLPTYNRAGTIVRAVRSVLNQTYANLELIVVDDGSTDATDKLLESIDDPRLKYVRMPKNGGQSAARNEGMRLATGDYIAFQDSDDEWLLEKLEKQVAAARDAAEDSVAVFHMRIVYGRDEARVYGIGRACCVPNAADADLAMDFRKTTHSRNLISPQTLLMSRACFEQVGYFDTSIKTSPDWEYSIRLAYETKVVFIREPLVMAYIQDDSISRMGRKAARSQLRIVLKLRRKPDVAKEVLAYHLGRIGMTISRFNKPRLAHKLLCRAVTLAPGDTKNWARLLANGTRALLPAKR